MESFSSCSVVSYMEYHQGCVKRKSFSVSDEVCHALFLNGERVGTLVSSPHALRSLVIGYCLAEGFVTSLDDIQAIHIDDGEAAFVTTAMVSSSVPHEDEPDCFASFRQRKFVPVSASMICSYGDLLNRFSLAHHCSHGVHEGALVREGTVLAYAEDIGRHNVLDRLRGLAAMQHLDVSDAVLVFSGRTPQSVITKVHGIGVPIIASRALPSSLGVSLAEQYGITLINGLRTDSFRVVAHGERIVFD